MGAVTPRGEPSPYRRFAARAITVVDSSVLPLPPARLFSLLSPIQRCLPYAHGLAVGTISGSGPAVGVLPTPAACPLGGGWRVGRSTRYGTFLFSSRPGQARR